MGTGASTETVKAVAAVFAPVLRAGVAGVTSVQDYAESSFFAQDYLGQRIAYEVPMALVQNVTLLAQVFLDTRGLNFPLRDLVAALDAAALAHAKVLNDNSVVLDAPQMDTAKALSEAQPLDDIFSYTAQFARLFNDPFVPVDTLQADTGKSTADIFAAADAYAAASTKALLDAFSPQDASTTTNGKALSDTTALSDGPAASFGKSTADASPAIDAGTVVNQNYADPIYFSADYVGDSRTF